MTKQTVLSPADLHYVGELFSKIAELSGTLHELSDTFIRTDRSDYDARRATCVREMAVTLGYLAEVGANKVGGSGFLENPEQWLLPPLPILPTLREAAANHR